MSFYRTLLASVAALVIASPVFADDTTQQSPSDGSTPAAQTDTSGSSMQQQTTSSDQQGAATTESKVNLNKATAKELMKVKGINAAKARAIVAYRKKHEKDGGFKSVDDLANVKGFKKVNADTMKEIEDQLTVD